MKRSSIVGVFFLLFVVQVVIAEEKAICDRVWYFSQNTGIDSNIELGHPGEIRVKLNSSKVNEGETGLDLAENGESFYILPNDPSIDRLYGILLAASSKDKPIELWYTEVGDRRIVTKIFYYYNGLDETRLPYDPTK